MYGKMAAIRTGSGLEKRHDNCTVLYCYDEMVHVGTKTVTLHPPLPTRACNEP